MNERKRLKKLLGDKYIFKIFLPLSEVKKLLGEKLNDTHEKLFASLTAGCVKINAIVFPNPDNMQIGFDILVKDKPDSTEWICYDTVTDEVKLSSYNLEQTIRDKQLICIIKQMLKSPIVLPNGNTIYPNKGTPQGGILSPLLANIVLNELDWWVSSQWETMPTHKKYKLSKNRNGVSECRSYINMVLRFIKT